MTFVNFIVFHDQKFEIEYSFVDIYDLKHIVMFTFHSKTEMSKRTSAHVNFSSEALGIKYEFQWTLFYLSRT